MNLPLYLKEIRRRGKRSFTIKELIDHFQISSNYARVALHRLLKSGDLISPVRGLYVIVPPEHQPYGSIPAEDLVPLIAQYLGIEYYAALLTAGLFHGATHQKPARFQVISNKQIKRLLTFGDITIEFIYKKSLSNLPTQDFVVSTGYLKVASPELVAIDLLLYPNHAGGLNHIATVLSELIENLDAVKLIQLAKNMRVEYQLQRIGYVLDHCDVMEEEKAKIFTDTLARYIIKEKNNYLPLASEIKKHGYSRCKKWRIIENTTIESDL
jgi:predicted transcriptional regulator of viral defense system